MTVHARTGRHISTWEALDGRVAPSGLYLRQFILLLQRVSHPQPFPCALRTGGLQRRSEMVVVLRLCGVNRYCGIHQIPRSKCCFELPACVSQTCMAPFSPALFTAVERSLHPFAQANTP